MNNESINLKNLKVLVVDDEEDLRILLASYLRRFGATVHQASSVQSSIDILKKHDRFDVVVSDYKMPGANGSELIHWVRQNYSSASTILLTGHLNGNSADVGVFKPDLVIQKPVSLSHIAVQISSLCHFKSTQAA